MTTLASSTDARTEDVTLTGFEPFGPVFIKHPAPRVEAAPLQLRTEFNVTGPVSHASVTATARGVYAIEVNGSDVGDHVLAPGWTAYQSRLIADTYTVTDALVQGRNALGVWLAGGWFTEKYGFLGKAQRFYGDQPAVALSLTITYSDGRTEVVATGEDWRVTDTGPLLSSGIYAGEAFDASRHEPAWSRQGFIDTHWAQAQLAAPTVESVEPPVGPPIVRTQELAPVSVVETSPGSFLYDFGQNFAGRLRIAVRGEAGRTVTIRHAEVLEDGDLSLRPLRYAAATDSYTLAGVNDGPIGEIWEPRFTFHGFRYARLDVVPGTVDITSVTGIVIHSDIARTAWFDSSHPLLNRLHENVVWSTRSNFLSLPTDCPQRDERLGWTGDIQVFAPTAVTLFDCDAFMRSWLRDLEIEQTRAHGVVPTIVPDVIKDFISTPVAAWGDAAVMVPWALYQKYGDLQVLRDQYSSMRTWVECVITDSNPDGIWSGEFQFGDWLDPAAPPEDPAAATTHPDLVATAHIFRSATLLARIADVLGEADDSARFSRHADTVRAAFHTTFGAPDNRLTSDAQTAYALALEFGLATDPVQRAGYGHRLAELVAEGGYRIGTGFVGTPIILDALAHTGHLAEAGRLLLQTQNPSWLYPVTRGATTIWERWDSLLEDGSVNPGEMTSFNHYALGAVADWLYRTLGGITVTTPGGATVDIAPHPIDGIDWVSTRQVSAAGTVSVSWRRTESGTISVAAIVAEGVTASVTLPGHSAPITVTGGTYEWVA